MSIFAIIWLIGIIPMLIAASTWVQYHDPGDNDYICDIFVIGCFWPVALVIALVVLIAYCAGWIVTQIGAALADSLKNKDVKH